VGASTPRLTIELVPDGDNRARAGVIRNANPGLPVAEPPEITVHVAGAVAQHFEMTSHVRRHIEKKIEIAESTKH
jgi:hypothetical protein